MKTLQLAKHQKARVWLNELPDSSYASSEVISYAVRANATEETWVTRAAVELLIPLGGRSMYGLIGGEFEPSSDGMLVVEICVSSGDMPTFSESLIASKDDVKTGLPAEYVRGICSGADIGSATLDRVVSGKFRVTCAAHGLMSSSEAIFSKLFIMLLKLLVIKEPEATDSTLIDLF